MPNRFRNLSWKKVGKWLLLLLIFIIVLVVFISFQTTNVQAIPSAASTFFISSSFYNLRTDCFLEFYDVSHGSRFEVTEEGIMRSDFIWNYDSEFGIVSINKDFEEEEWRLFTIKEGLFDDSTRIIYERYEGLISQEITKEGKQNAKKIVQT